MFSKLFSKATATTHKGETLAEFQVNFGEMVPEWERLKDLTIKRNADVEGLLLDVWSLVFEQHSLIMFFDQSEHNMLPQGEERFSSLRLRATFVKAPGQQEFEPADDRFWFRQIDQIRENVLPRLNGLYPGNLD